MSDSDAQPTIDELLDRGVRAINLGDREAANALAGQVLSVDRANPEAEELLAAPSDHGEIRRLTIMFADLVDSTALSTRIELEVYRTVVGRYRDEVLKVVNRYEGHVGSTKGDGLLVVFGHPKAHENDAHRAVYAGLDIVREIVALSKHVQRRFGFDISVRVGIHRGLVYLDTAQDDVYGLGANLAARMCSLAEPDTVAVSVPIERVVRDTFDLEAKTPQLVKGVDELIHYYRVIGDRDVTTGVDGPLIGREHELAYLQQSWAQANAGRLATPGVAFQGEGGIGKTRIALAAVEIAQQTGAVVLGLYGSPFHTDVGLRPVRRLLERRCGIKRDSDPAERLRKLENEVEQRGLDTATVVPLLAPVLGIGHEIGYEPVHAGGAKLYGQIATAIHAYLLACLGSGTGLVFVDDVHWFDEDTIEIVQGLLREESGRLLVVITGRTLPAFSCPVETFTVTPLDEADTDKLVLALHPAMTPDARSAVQKRCDGIPLYIEEVVAKLREQPSDAGESSMVPDTLYETLFARLRSGPDMLRVVEAAALIGSRFDRSLLSAVVDLELNQVDQVLAELVRGRVIQAVDEDSWRFHHELLREVAAEVAPPTVRRDLHSRIADGLVTAAADANPEWPLVARHYESANRFDEAVKAHKRAASDARRRGALNEARSYLSRALVNIARAEPGRARDRREIAVRLESGFLASAALGHASIEAAAEFERCLQLIGPDPSPELYATLNALWSFYTARGDLRRGTQLAESLRTNVDDLSGIGSDADDAVYGVLAGFRGQYDKARSTLERAAAHVRNVPIQEMTAWYAPNDPFAGMYSFLAFTRFVQGDLSGAETALAQMEARCTNLGFPHGAFSLCYGRSIDAWIRSEAGQLELGMQRADEFASLAQQYSFDEWVMVAWSEQTAVRALQVLAAGESDAGALAPHIETMTTVVETWRAFDVRTFLAFYDGVLARLLIAAGELGAARDRLDVALKMGQDTWIQFYDAELLRLRSHTLTDGAERHRHLREAVEVAQRQGAHVFELRSAADDFALTGDPARQALLEAISRFPADQTWPELTHVRALLE
ncbi:adenylate/guanylate cyclase domain-containing protein [Mycolicibacterium sp. P9-64]|uniref:ATP-binding protein n=1 Tax=Mycolicibacterium sp. P9-64 TaxID=2024612 RepID=UPI0011EE3422|nr:adenylate/guanylate cyclase domain-containing protein [Mycolicibacterium sp. P9-64]KAA0075642.1 adenylate/guanylate cyclase domain-containing protein [Mycolicibacterium sp. P9-64]